MKYNYNSTSNSPVYNGHPRASSKDATLVGSYASLKRIKSKAVITVYAYTPTRDRELFSSLKYTTYYKLYRKINILILIIIKIL